mmetsp:Transcript_52885/g.141313  ORF Transcript_52885/g.141313 Transcript_52885/m.141313 type:complete len:210 (+) Transcript_52885:1619-2248(+)
MKVSPLRLVHGWLWLAELTIKLFNEASNDRLFPDICKLFTDGVKDKLGPELRLVCNDCGVRGDSKAFASASRAFADFFLFGLPNKRRTVLGDGTSIEGPSSSLKYREAQTSGDPGELLSSRSMTSGWCCKISRFKGGSAGRVRFPSNCEDFDGLRKSASSLEDEATVTAASKPAGPMLLGSRVEGFGVLGQEATPPSSGEGWVLERSTV